MLPQLQLIEDFFPIDSFIEEPPKGTGQFRYDRYGTITEVMVGCKEYVARSVWGTSISNI